MDAELLTRTIGELFRLSNVVASWLLTYALHSTIWILVAWLLTSRRFLRHEPGTQHAVWSASIAAGFLTTTLQLSGAVSPLTGSLRVAEQVRQTVAAVVVNDIGAPGRVPKVRLATLLTPPGEGARVPHAGDRIVRMTTGAMRSAPARGNPPHAFFRTMVIAPPPSLFAILPWLLVAVVLLARLAWSHRVLRRSLGDGRNAAALPAGVALRHLRCAAGVRRDVSLVVTDAIAAPAAVSTGEIALPSRLLAELTPLEQEGVLAHELAHVVRRDTLWLRLALVMECVAWFQPLNRIARRRMQLAAEFAADAWAVRVTRQPLGLARSLARIAEWVVAKPAPVPLGAVLGADGSPLMQRMRRLTAPAVPRAASRVGVRFAALLAVAATAALSVTLPSVAVGRASPATSLGERKEVRILVRTAERRAAGTWGAPMMLERVIRNN